MKKLVLPLIALLVSAACLAAPSINTVGSDDSTAISGYDVVSFFKGKTGVVGEPKYAAEYGGASWRFATEENLKEFQADPDKFVPAWGGHCAWAVSEKTISAKKLSGDFEIINGKLYLFSFGNQSKSGAKDDFLYGKWGKNRRLADGEKAWPDLKSQLEVGTLPQADSKKYRKTSFE